MKHIEIAENQEEATCIIHSFLKKGFTSKDIYLLAYDKEWAHNLTDATHTKKIQNGRARYF